MAYWERQIFSNGATPCKNRDPIAAKRAPNQVAHRTGKGFVRCVGCSSKGAKAASSSNTSLSKGRVDFNVPLENPTVNLVERILTKACTTQRISDAKIACFTLDIW